MQPCSETLASSFPSFPRTPAFSRHRRAVRHTTKSVRIAGKFVIAGTLLAHVAEAAELRGRLVDRASLAQGGKGEGIAQATLGLYAPTGKRIASKKSGKDGAFSFSGISPGAYTLKVYREDTWPKNGAYSFRVTEEDAQPRWIALDKLPISSGTPLYPEAKKGDPAGTPRYYESLAAGMLAQWEHEEFFREDTEAIPTPLSAYYDPADTSAAARQLRVALLWSQFEAAEPPLETRIYLAHGFAAVLKDKPGFGSAPGGKAWLSANPDSVESLSRHIRLMILKPSAKNHPKQARRSGLPKSVILDLMAEKADQGWNKAKLGAFLNQVRSVYGKRVENQLAKREAIRKAKEKGSVGDGPDLLADCVAREATGKRINPAALFFLASREWSEGKRDRAIAHWQSARQLRPDHLPTVGRLAEAHLELEDTQAARPLLQSLTEDDDLRFQALGHFGLGRLYALEGKPDASEAAYWKGMGLDADSPEASAAVKSLAAAALASGRTDAVETALRNRVQSHPRDGEAHYWLGRIAATRDQEGVAEHEYRLAMRLQPEAVRNAEALGELLSARDACDGTLTALKPYRTRLSPDGLELYASCLSATGQSGKAVEEFERLHAEHPSPGTQAAWGLAVLQSGDPKGALKVLDQSAFTAAPEMARARAQVLLELRRGEEALRLIEPLLIEHPNDADLHTWAGMAFYQTREYGKAGKALSAALRFKADNPLALQHHGLVLLKQNRAAEAQHYFKELTDRRSPKWQAKGWLGRGMAFAQDDKPEAALEAFSKSQRIHPTAEGAAYLALESLKSKDEKGAEKWSRESRRLDPAHPLGLMAQVDWLLSQEKPDEAVKVASKALETHAESCEHLLVAAKAQYRSGHPQKTGELSRKANDLCPTEPSPHFYLGAVAAQSGDEAKAKHHFRQYRSMGGNPKSVPKDYR